MTGLLKAVSNKSAVQKIQKIHHISISLLLVSLLAGIVSLWLIQTVRVHSQSTATITVVHQVDAGGTVTSDIAGVNCGSDCQGEYAPNTTVTLTATPSSGRKFYRWSIDTTNCAGATSSFPTSPTCSVTTSESSNIEATAYWIYEKYNITVQRTGTGIGTVTSSPAGINCGASCTVGYPYDTAFTLTATPNSDSTFVHWEYTGADVCIDLGKGGGEVNTNPVCSSKPWNVYRQNYVAIARFDKKSSSTTGGSPSQANTASSETPSEVAKPEAPKLEKTKIDGQTIDSAKPITVAANKPLVLSGKTVPNGIVTLYIFSEPKTATTTADAEGNWQYAVANLPAGDHHIEVEVKDPATGQTSDRDNLLAFTVTEPVESTGNSDSLATRPNRTLLFASVAGVLFAAMLAAGAYWWFVRRPKKSKTSSATDSIMNTENNENQSEQTR